MASKFMVNAAFEARLLLRPSHQRTVWTVNKLECPIPRRPTLPPTHVAADSQLQIILRLSFHSHSSLSRTLRLYFHSSLSKILYFHSSLSKILRLYRGLAIFWT
jgi:hypothetical protein